MRVHTGASPIAADLRAWRLAQGLTQWDVAKVLHTHPNNVARWERGEVWPDRAWSTRLYRLMSQVKPTPKGGPVPHECKRLRQLLALKQTEAAKLFHVSERTWRRWETGAVEPTVSFWRIADRLTRELRRG